MLPLSTSFFLSPSLSFSSRLLLGAAVERIAERDMAAGEKYPFAKAVSFGRASRRHCVARWRRRLRTLSSTTHPAPPLALGLFYLRAFPTARETHPLRLRHDPPVSCTYVRMRERKRKRSRVCVSMCVYAIGRDIGGSQGAEE